MVGWLLALPLYIFYFEIGILEIEKGVLQGSLERFTIFISLPSLDHPSFSDYRCSAMFQVALSPTFIKRCMRLL
jgi:hypothetical protein